MKKLNNFKSSFLYRLIMYFIFMIVIPILCIWWLYERVLISYYRENTLATWQLNIENSLSLLDSTLETIENVFVAMEGNQEILYYVEYKPLKENMMYGTFKRVDSFCEELSTMTPYLTSLKIYCDSPLPIYAGPFVKMEEFIPEENLAQELDSAGFGEIVWRIVASDTEEFPAVFAYKKLYTDNYMKCLGYIEVQLSSQLFSDYFQIVSRLVDNPQSVWALYHDGTLLYSTFPAESAPVYCEDVVQGYEIVHHENLYRNYLKIPEWKLCLIGSGCLTDVNIMASDNVPSIFFSVFLMLILVLFVAFLMNIVSLSKRILAFSSFIQESNSENLLPFRPKKRDKYGKDELDVLVDAYNMLIRENNSLISEVQRMELFTKDARFQALQGQIHPHFIYGTMEMIRMVALQNRDKEVASMIFSFSTLLRYSMSISTKAVTLREEMEMAKHYLSIQKMRFDDRIEYDFRVEEELLDLEMPSFILQPILENAIVYGISQTLDTCMLIVEAYKVDGQVIIVISNTGLPITQQRLEEVNALLSGKTSANSFKGKENGLALNNIKERINIFYSGRASIRLRLQEEKTATVITIMQASMSDIKEEGAICSVF